jgi:class 3 adenylate cyclase
MDREALHRTTFMIDVQDSGRLPDPNKLTMRKTLWSVVRQALAFAGIEAGVRLEDRGDGILGLLTADVPKVRLLGAGIEGLDRALSDSKAAIRLRIGIHGGEVYEDEWGVAGSDVDLACRLADAPMAKQTLETASAARLAAVVSEAVYESVVRHGGRYLFPEQYAPVHVKIKETDRTAWLYLPGYSTPPFPPPVPGTATAGPSGPAPASGRQINFHGGPSAYFEGIRVDSVHVGHVYHRDEQ